MRRIRVLVIDDSVVVRQMVKGVLSTDAAIEVVGIAANGRIAMEKIPLLKPDLVTLDIEMPVMNGLEFLKALKGTSYRLKIIMFSTLTEHGATATLEAMSLGAHEYVTKPTGTGNLLGAKEQLREELLPKIKSLCPLKLPVQARPGLEKRIAAVVKPPAKSIPVFRPRRRDRIDLVAIGISTGGPNTLTTLLPKFPADFPVPIVIVQHMPPIFTRLLAERLNGLSAITVTEAKDGDTLKAGHALLAPGGYHMATRRNGTFLRISLNQDPPENSCRPAVDVLFRSVAATARSHALAIVLTGMGQDGKLGCEKIVDVGGQTLVQDEASSVVWGMPGAVSKAGLADKVVPLEQMDREIMTCLKLGR